MTQADKLARVEESLTRWHRRLNRAVGAIKRLDAKRKRLLTAKPKSPAAPTIPDDNSIPTFLRRTPADTEAAAKIKAEQADLKRRKKAGQDAKRKAAARGETRRMPLQGREALAAIRGE